MEYYRAKLEELESVRRNYIQQIRSLSSLKFNEESWEELKQLVYNPRKLNIDVIIDDTTLREGLQMAGIEAPSPEDAVRIAELLMEIGVERLEVMSYTKTDKDAIKLMKERGYRDNLAVWCRALKEDVDIAIDLDIPQIGISHPVSYIHFEKWSSTPLWQLIDRVVSTVEYAKEHGLTVFVHGEDSTRADWNFEKIFINAVAEAGALVYRICDTVGCGVSDPSASLPNGIPEKIRRIKRETKIPCVEIHAHDDMGNAVENTLAAIRAADGIYDKIYVSTTFLGIGDRAGNAETEKVILNCYIHHDMRKWNLRPFRELANFIASSLNYHLPVNKAIVGDAAFSHESGIHLYGISIMPFTYEAFPPELVGHTRSIVIGKRSGKHGIRMKLSEITEEEIKENDERFQSLLKTIRTEYIEKARKYAIKDSEFKELARKFGFKVKG